MQWHETIIVLSKETIFEYVSICFLCPVPCPIPSRVPSHVPRPIRVSSGVLCPCTVLAASQVPKGGAPPWRSSGLVCVPRGLCRICIYIYICISVRVGQPTTNVGYPEPQVGTSKTKWSPCTEQCGAESSRAEVVVTMTSNFEQ